MLDKFVKKIPFILLGIVIGYGITFLLDHYRENQASAYVNTVYSNLLTNKLQQEDNLEVVNIELLQAAGELKQYKIIKNDTSFNFNNEIGLHYIAMVTTYAEYDNLDLVISLQLIKNNGEWSTSKIFITQK